MANKDVLKITFDADTKQFEQNLLSSMENISDEASARLGEVFAKAGRNPKLRKQLTGVYQGLFDELMIASGDLDKVNEAIDRFAGKIEYINTVARKSKIPGIFDNLSVEDVNKVLKGYDAVIEKEQQLAKITSDEYRDNIRTKTTVKSLKSLENAYETTSEAKEKYEGKVTEYIKKAGVETSVISKEIKEYSNLIALFERINTTKVEYGSEDAVKKAQSLLYVMQKITDLESGNKLFSNFRKNELGDIEKITSSISELTVNGVEGSINSLVGSMKRPLTSAITELYNGVIKELLKMSKHQAISAAKTQVKVENAMRAGNGKGNGTSTSTEDGVLPDSIETPDGIDVWTKSAEELTDEFRDVIKYATDVETSLKRVNEIWDKYANGKGTLLEGEIEEMFAIMKRLDSLEQNSFIDKSPLNKEQLEEFNEILFEPEYEDVFERIDQLTDKQLKKIEQLKAESKTVAKDGTGGSGGIDDSKVEELREEIAEVKEDLTALKGRVDTLEDTTAFDNLSSQVEGFDERVKIAENTLGHLNNTVKDLTKNQVKIFDGTSEIILDSVKDAEKLEEILDRLANQMKTPVFHAGDLEPSTLTSNYKPGDNLKFVTERGRSDSVGSGIYSTSNLADVIDWMNAHADQARKLYVDDLAKYSSQMIKLTTDEEIENFSKLLQDITTSVMGDTKYWDIYSKDGKRYEKISPNSLYQSHKAEFDGYKITLEQLKEFILNQIKYINSFSDTTSMEYSPSVGTNFQKELLNSIGLDLTNNVLDDSVSRGNVVFDIDQKQPYTVNFGDNTELAKKFFEKIYKKVLVNKASYEDNDIDDILTQYADALPVSEGTNEWNSLRTELLEIQRKQVEKVTQGYAEGQDSHSPSKEAEKLNDDFVAGIEESANKNTNNLNNVGRQMAENVKDGFKEGMAKVGDTTLSDSNQNGILSGDTTTPIVEGHQEVQKELTETENAVNEVAKAYDVYRQKTEAYNKESEKTEEIMSRLTPLLKSLKRFKGGGLYSQFQSGEVYDGGNELDEKFLNSYFQKMPSSKKGIKEYIDKILSNGSSSEVLELQKVMSRYEGEYYSITQNVFNDLTSKTSKQKALYLSEFTGEYVKHWETLKDELKVIKADIKPLVQELLDALNIKEEDHRVDSTIDKLLNDHIYKAVDDTYVHLNDIMESPEESFKKIFDWNNYIDADYFKFIDISDINNAEELNEKLVRLRETAQNLESQTNEAFLQYTDAAYSQDSKLNANEEWEKYQNLKKQTDEIWTQYAAYERLSRIVKEMPRQSELNQSGVSLGDQTEVLSGTEKPVQEAEQYKQVSQDTVSVLSDIGKTEDEIIAKIQKERQEAEANNKVLREHLVLLDAAGKVVANHWGSESNVNGTFTDEQLAQAKGGKVIHAHPGKASFFGGGDLKHLFQDAMYEQIKQVELIWGDSSLLVDKSSLTKQSTSTIHNIMKNVRTILTELYGDNGDGKPSREAREHINAIEKEIFKAVAQKLNVSVSETGTQSKEVVDALSDVDKAIIQRFKDVKANMVQDLNPFELIKDNKTPLSSSDIVEENNREIASNEEVIASEEKKHKYKIVARTEIPKLSKQESSAIVNANEEVINSNEEVIRSEEKVKKYTLANRNNTPKLKTEPIKDTLDVTTESAEMEKVETATEQAVQAKKDFATANEGVQDSVDGSKSKLQLEAELMESIAKNARDAAKAKKDFVNANKEVKASADSSSESLDKESKSMDKVEEATAKNNKKAEEIEKMNADAKTTPISNRIASLAKSDKIGTAEYDKLMITIGDIINLQGKYTEEVDGSAKSTKRLSEASKKFTDDLLKDFDKNSESLYKSFNATISNITDGKNFNEKDSNVVNTLRDNLKSLENFELNNIDDVKNLVQLINQISVGIKDVKAIPKENLLPDASELNKDLGNINKVLAGGYKMSSQLRQEYKALQKAYEDAFDSNGNVKITNKELQKMRDILSKVNAEFDATGRKKSLFGSFGQRLTDMNTKFLAQYFSFQDIIRYGRQAFETIKEYDTALTEMNKVSDESIQTLKEFQTESFELANAIGTTASQIQKSTADWMRLGESLEEAKQSAQDANILFNVSEFGSIDEATDSLVAMSQAYSELEKMEIVDIMNEIGNNYSISTDGLASALQRSAATLKVAGNDIYEATALITAGNAILQDAEAVGTGLKMISLRILGTEEAKEELASLGENVDDFVVQTKSKLDETVRDYTAVASNGFKGISVLDENGNYRSTYEILRDISKVYQEILETDKKAGTNRGQALLEVLAGKNRSNVAASILNSPELLESVYESAQNADGSALKENEAYLESIQGHLDQIKNSWDNIWVSEENREFINGILDAVKKLLDGINELGGAKALLVGAGGIFTAFKAFKGEGKWGFKIVLIS